MYVQFLDQNNLESEICARREILKPFKKLDNTGTSAGFWNST